MRQMMNAQLLNTWNDDDADELHSSFEVEAEELGFDGLDLSAQPGKKKELGIMASCGGVCTREKTRRSSDYWHKVGPPRDKVTESKHGCWQLSFVQRHVPRQSVIQVHPHWQHQTLF